jgi:hypothetical protein
LQPPLILIARLREGRQNLPASSFTPFKDVAALQSFLSDVKKCARFIAGHDAMKKTA